MMDAHVPLAAALAGRYEIERELGQGGMAVVYLARDVKNGRPVALKVLRPELGDSLGAERFLREIAIAAPLVHQNILPIHDSGEAAGCLYYVMPYVEGATLRQRLDRELQLPIDDAIEIARQVAAALDYAHGRGVIHRDIKPENLLMLGEHVLIADFGLARAISSASSRPLTSHELMVGTPAYMSPEQCTPGRAVDGRSDIYSLGCVIFEMIAGVPPFRGATAQVMMTHHLTSDPPSVCAERASCPSALDDVLRRALAKVPADRYRTAGEFVRALEQARGGMPAFGAHRPAGRRPSHARRVLIGAGAATGVAAVAVLLWIVLPAIAGSDSTGVGDTSRPGDALDTTRIAIMVETSGDTGATTTVARQLEIATRRWSGITVVSGPVTADGRGARGWDPFGRRTLRTDAQRLGAGRYITVWASSIPGATAVRAALHDTRGSAMLAQAAGTLERGQSADSALAALADTLLFRDGMPPARYEEVAGTRSLPARQAYARGHRALQEWDLAEADSAFFHATRYDRDYAQAFLWVAQLRHWLGLPVAQWRFAVEQAESGRNRLGSRGRQHASALSALARHQPDRACAILDQLARADSTDALAWFSLGTCLRRDDIVVPDRRSPSGWRFRSSYAEALRAHQHAFELLPAMHRSYRGRSYLEIRQLLMTSTGSLRSGRLADGEASRFLAYPSWQSDSLAFIPYPENEFTSARAATRSEAVMTAIRRQRSQFHQIAMMWRAAYPSSVDALEAVAVSLDLQGNAAAFDTLRAARETATDADDRLRLACLEVWMLVKFSIPDDVRGLVRARRLADSVLRSSGTGTRDRSEARLLASLAALLGRARAAAALSRVGEAAGVPPGIAQTAPALLVFAAMGGPADSLAALEPRVSGAIRMTLSGSERESAIASWLLRSAFLAVPEREFPLQSLGAAGGSMSARLLAAWQARDLARARTLLDDLRERRRQGFVRASDVTLDALYPEAAILAVLGDHRAALRWLRPTLDSLSMAETQHLAQAVAAGALVRAMILRAELAGQANNRAEARTWARAALALWDPPDDFLAPKVDRLRVLAR